MHIQNLIYIILISFLLPVPSAAQSVADVGKPNFGHSFVPDQTFQGSNLDDWYILGEADWRAENDEIIGDASSGDGWLILNKSYQDVGFRTLFKCAGNCDTGVMFRMEKTENGYTGVFMSLNQDDLIPYRVMLNEGGEITSRRPLRYAGGINYRVAPIIEDDDGGSPSRRNSNFSPPDPLVDRPIARPNTQFRRGEWNQIESFLDVNVIRSFLNDGNNIGGHIGSAGQQNNGLDGYGPIALYVGREGEVRFADVMWKDIAMRYTPIETSSSRFRVQRINDMYYSWGAHAADFNQNGVIDIVAGPFLYYGPEYTTHREILPAITGSPSKEFPYNRVQYAYDFDNDGWPDILATTFGNTRLYINPRGESRRWDSYGVLPGVQQGEITILTNIDGDQFPELVYSASGAMHFAKYNPSDPTQPWEEYIISEEGYGMAHGIGTGDINGNGRIDIVNAYGWWEQPEEIEQGKLWQYHKAALGRYGRRSGGVGGSIMAIYDVNGNGLNDVVTNLNAHGFGFAWYEQQRADDGTISFREHMISDDYSAPAAGDVIFSQPHGATFADVDQDGIKDFIVGKRYWSHLDNYADPDPYGEPVIYWYRTERDPEAPGGAKFVPELIHNRSGAGSQITAVDLNKNGAVDIITSTNRGTFIFWNNPY